MPRRKRWNELEIRDGFGQIRVLKWRYFVEYINQRMLNYDTCIWRGQRCDNWSLKSTLDRLIEKAGLPKNKQQKFGNSHLERFQYASRGRRGPHPAPPIENENEWWAIGQHHGLASPLLDWTASPFVAAYFAFIGTGADQTKYRAIYALHKPSVEKKVRQLLNLKQAEREEKQRETSVKSRNALAVKPLDSPIRPEVEFFRPRSDENQRLVNQSGLFTRAPDAMSLEEWVQKNFIGESTGYTLMKLLIPNGDREECLRMLNRMNINHLTLFPDLFGASKFCNLFGEIEKY
jgi:hypothetical protein